MLQALVDAREGRGDEQGPSDTVIAEEIRGALAELDLARRQIDTVHTVWSPETLQLALANELPGSEVIVVSNREPYIHNHGADGEHHRPAPGLGTRLGAGAGHPRLRRHLDRAWLRLRRPRGG